MRSLITLSIIGILLPAAYAQQIAYQPIFVTFLGDSATDFFGVSVAGAGDVNNDGIPDVIVGARGDDNNGSDSGSARVFSGVDGTILYTFNGDSANDQFGQSVSGAGDVNNDGFNDVIVGAYNDSSSGTARVFSGATGGVLYTFNGDSASDAFGYSVRAAGDVNNDGFDDVIVGAYLDDNNGPNSGSARVFSGATGAILYTFNGDSADDWFGRAVSGAGDVNKDGFDDLIVGVLFDDNNGSNSGSARVFSGASGAILYTFNGDSASDFLGYSVSGAGDVNNDGHDDLIAGASGAGGSAGRAQVFSGATGGILYTFTGTLSLGQLGNSVSGAGDVNNDGFDDLIVGASGVGSNGTATGSARVFSGATGTILYTFNGDAATDNFGSSVDGVGDVNNDGLADFIVGSVSHDGNGMNSGLARLLVSSVGGWPVVPPPPGPCPGDADGNHAVNFADITNVLTNFNLPCP